MLDTAILKNEEQAVFALRSLYRRYGYLPYKMRKFEDYEYYIRNKDFLVSDRIITFNDTNGTLLALKPDVTLSIIKNGEDVPGCKQKVCYNENVYRVSENTHRFKEILQAGLECIGDIDLYDIFETVSLAAQSLALISEDFALQVSHLGILSDVLDRVCGDLGFQEKAIGFLKSKNAHDLTRLCREYGVEDTLPVRLLSAYGQRSKVINILEDMGCGGEALEELKALSILLDSLPWSDRILFDFSLVNNRKYYNGIVFRGFVEGVPEGVLSGGEYDGLMERMHRKEKAIGFALYPDLLERLEEPTQQPEPEAVLLYDPDASASAVTAAAQKLRAEGTNVCVLPDTGKQPNAAKCYVLKGNEVKPLG